MATAEIQKLLASEQSSSAELWSRLRARVQSARASDGEAAELANALAAYLEAAKPGPAMAWAALARAAVLDGYGPAAQTFCDLEWARVLFRSHGEALGEAVALRHHGAAARAVGRPVTAERSLNEAVALFRSGSGASDAWRWELGVALRCLAELRLWKRENVKVDPARDSSLAEALAIVNGAPADTASPDLLRDVCAARLLDAQCCRARDQGDGEAFARRLGEAADAARRLLVSDPKSASSQAMFLEILINTQWPSYDLAAAPADPAVRLRQAVATHAQVYEFQGAYAASRAPRWLLFHATLALATCLERGGRLGLAAAHFRELGRLARAVIDADRTAFVGVTLAARADRELLAFYARHPRRAPSGAAAGSLKRRLLRDERRANESFPEMSAWASKSIYDYFAALGAAELKKMADDATEALARSASRAGAERAAVKLAPFFLDCTFPRLDQDDQERMRRGLDAAEEKWGSLANVLGLDNEPGGTDGSNDASRLGEAHKANS